MCAWYGQNENIIGCRLYDPHFEFNLNKMSSWFLIKICVWYGNNENVVLCDEDLKGYDYVKDT